MLCDATLGSAQEPVCASSYRTEKKTPQPHAYTMGENVLLSVSSVECLSPAYLHPPLHFAVGVELDGHEVEIAGAILAPITPRSPRQHSRAVILSRGAVQVVHLGSTLLR